MSIELTKHSNNLKSVKFLVSAMDLKDLRWHTSHFKVESDGAGVSTNGARLHWTAETGLDPGYYSVHKNTKSKMLIEKVAEVDTNEGSFPDYTDLLLLPDNPGINVNLSPDYNFKAYTAIIRKMEVTTLNYDFVNDICTCFDDTAAVMVPDPDQDNGTCKPVHFVKNGFHAVLMPCRIDY